MRIRKSLPNPAFAILLACGMATAASCGSDDGITGLEDQEQEVSYAKGDSSGNGGSGGSMNGDGFHWSDDSVGWDDGATTGIVIPVIR